MLIAIGVTHSTQIDNGTLQLHTFCVNETSGAIYRGEGLMDLVIHGPEEGTENICFVLMAINSQMKRIFKDVFEPVAKEFSLKAEHADMLTSLTVVPESIKKIHVAKVILADVTRHCPNVYYEIGFSHKVNPNKVIIIGQEPYDELPSNIDQQSFRYIHYGDDENGLADLRVHLRKRFQNYSGHCFLSKYAWA